MTTFESYLDEWQRKLTWSPYATPEDYASEQEELRKWRDKGYMTDEDELTKLDEDAAKEAE
jgi:hypothetical protein